MLGKLLLRFFNFFLRLFLILGRRSLFLQLFYSFESPLNSPQLVEDTLVSFDNLVKHEVVGLWI